MFLILHVCGCEPITCELPPPPIKVHEAFINNTVTRNIGTPRYLPDTIIYMGCIEGYVAIYPGIITNTCTQDGTWSEEFVRCGKLFLLLQEAVDTFLTLEKELCWWPVSGRVTYNGKVLHQYAKGYPYGSELANGVKCHRDGHWRFVKLIDSTESVSTESVSTESVPTESVTTESVPTESISARPRELATIAILIIVFILVNGTGVLLANCYVPTYQPVSK